jgi:hypothetical protein
MQRVTPEQAAVFAADYAAIVRTLREVQNRHWDEYRTELVKNALSTPRARKVVGA